MIWQHSNEELYSFLHALNSFHEMIKFTADISETSVNFLDVKVTKDTHGNITKDLFTKPTDSHLYLHFSSFHPKHQKRNLPYSQDLRLCRICSTNELFRKASQNLFNDFILRGYPIQLVKSPIQKAASLNREDLFQPTTTDAQNKNIILFIITHNPCNPPISQILSKYRWILETSEEVKTILGSKTLVVYKRATNLKQLLSNL